MNCIIELNSGWKITGYGMDGKIVGPFDGTVPGVVHTNLLRHGLIKDPFWRDQVLDSQWVEVFSWVYEMEFIWPEYGDCKNAELIFEGLDTLAVQERLKVKRFSSHQTMKALPQLTRTGQ